MAAMEAILKTSFPAKFDEMCTQMHEVRLNDLPEFHKEYLEIYGNDNPDLKEFLLAQYQYVLMSPGQEISFWN